MEGVGMRGTTKDLFSGTSKPTRQLPGYGGFIPQAHRQVSAAEDQAAGNSLRNTFHAKTNLMLTMNPAPPGYTGHRSRAPEHMSLGRRVRTSHSIAVVLLYVLRCVSSLAVCCGGVAVEPPTNNGEGSD